MLYVQHWSFKAGYHQKGAEKFLGGGGDYPGVEMIGRYHAPGSLEGWIVLKTDDPKAIYQHAAEWGEFLNWETTPVFTDEEAGPIVAKVYSQNEIDSRSKIRGNKLLFLMNTLIISTFSCTFEEFKNDVTTLFLEEMCKEFVTDYEFVKVNEHKSHLLMNCTDLEKLGAEMESPFAKEWDKANNCKDKVYKLELVE